MNTLKLLLLAVLITKSCASLREKPARSLPPQEGSDNLSVWKNNTMVCFGDVRGRTPAEVEECLGPPTRKVKDVEGIELYYYPARGEYVSLMIMFIDGRVGSWAYATRPDVYVLDKPKKKGAKQ